VLERCEDDIWDWESAQYLVNGLPDQIMTTSIADIDDDGDSDMAIVVGWPLLDGSLHLYENTGSDTLPVWTVREDYFPEWLWYYWDHLLSAKLADFDSDGDQDLLILTFMPEWNVGPAFFLNSGTGVDPEWEHYNGVSGLSEPVWESALGDLIPLDYDSDSDRDIVLLASPRSQLYVYENGGNPDSVAFDSEPALVAGALWGNDDICWPALTDIDWDGDLDILISTSATTLSGPGPFTSLYQNVGDDQDPAWCVTGNFEIPSIGAWGHAYYAFGDLDDDFHDDLMIDGAKFCWRRGSADDPIWEEDPTVVEGLAYLRDLSFHDYDADGLLDIAYRHSEGRSFYQNMGTIDEPSWESRPDWAEGLPNSVTGFGYLDSDGYLDAVAVQPDSTLQCFLGVANQADRWITTPNYLTGLKLPSPPLGLLLTNLDSGAGNDLVAGFWSGELLFYSNTSDVAATPHPGSAQLALSISPHPARTGASICASTPCQAYTEIMLYDLSGRRIADIWTGTPQATEIRFSWPTGPGLGTAIPPGIYLLRVATISESASSALIILP
jgi:hypothetical protein